MEQPNNNSSRPTFSLVFHINEFKIGNLENASAINIGHNYPTNFRGYKRHSQGLGTIEGNNNDIHDIKAHMNQKYLVDALVEGKDDLPDWIKEFTKDSEDDLHDEEESVSFEHITSLMGVEEVPTIFREIASNQPLFEKIVEYMKKQWNSSEPFFLFYNEILLQLNRLNIESQAPELEYEISITLANYIEKTAKALLVVLYVVQNLLPGYLLKCKEWSPSLEHALSPNDPNELVGAIKALLDTKELPEAFSWFNDYPQILYNTYYNVLSPLIQTKEIHPFFMEMKHLYVKVATNIKDDDFEIDLTQEEQSLIFKVLIQHLHDDPKHILLAYLFLPL